MKIILRKRDSVVSVILFIFNIFHEYTGSYSIKLDHLIRCMSFFDKNETAARMGLSRMVKAEILINKKVNSDVYYELTQLGKDNINLWNLGVSRFFKRYSLRHQQWNKKWYMLALLNFSRTENQPIMDQLTEIGFRELTKDLWISPYSISPEANELLAEKFDFVEISGEISGEFNKQEILEKIFGIEALKSRYNEFLSLSNSIKNSMVKDINRNEEYLPLLFELGWNFYDITINDPALPKAFLDSWVGDKAVAEMRDLRSSLYNHITIFFSELISKD
ncbi:MAG: PaaX family transcriptional regulator C-terminal domain-containing protein [Bacillota bacterium]